MRTFFFTLFCFILLLPPAAGAREVLVVQSLPVKPYDDALRGFRVHYGGKLKKLDCAKLKAADIQKEVQRDKPELILAIGRDALAKVKEIKETPIVYLMVLHPGSMADGENITGVSMRISPDKQLAAMEQVIPNLKKIGLLFDPAGSDLFVRNAQLAARARGMELLAREVRDPKEALRALAELKDKIGAFWMIPDTRVVTPETVELLLLSLAENRIPAVTFSDKYVEMGALLSLGIDPFDLGRQAGELARNILAGKPPRHVPRLDARSTAITINLNVARKLGIPINGEILRKARVVQ